MNQKLIKHAYAAAEAIEPELTFIMFSTDNTVLAKNALKSKKSYRKKVKNRMVRNGITQREAMSQIKDLLRYTAVTCSPDDAVITARHLIRKLEQCGCVYLVSLTKDYFKKPKESGYMGLHLYFSYHGIIFEIQIHTLETLKMKEETHALYKRSSLQFKNIRH